VAHDVPSALEAARVYGPDAALEDTGLPGMDGYEAARRLRTAARLEESLSITVTGYASQEERRRSRPAGCNAHKDLAGILAKHFKGAAEFEASPEGTGNCLLVNARPGVFDDVVKLLELLDQRP
jgi:CheY-like chemotaxis protein